MKSPQLDNRRFSEAAAQGLRVFPVNVSDGPPPVAWTDYEARQPSTAELAAWDASGYNVGVICGAPSDVVVLAIENCLNKDLGQFQLPVTPCLVVGRTKHHYFKKPATDVGRAVSIECVRLTAFGDGSTVIGAGSVAPDGCVYAWELSPSDVPVAEMPPHLIAELTHKGNNRYGETKYLNQLSAGTHDRVWEYLVGLYAQCIGEVELMGEGLYRDKLHRAAEEVALSAVAAGADWHVVAELFKGAALKLGLEPHETADLLEQRGMDELYDPGDPLGIAVRWVYDEQSASFCRRTFPPECCPAEAQDFSFDEQTAHRLLATGLMDRINVRADHR